MSIDTNYEFPVELRQAHVYLNDNLTELPRVRAVVRTDTEEVIGQVSDRYKVFTHKQVMDQAFKYTNGIQVLGDQKNKVRLSQNGAFMQSSFDFVDKKFAVRNGDFVGFRFNVVNSYNGKKGLTMQIGGLVMTCMNGLIGQSEDSFSLNWRHTKEFEFIEFPEPEILIAAWDKNCKDWKELAKLNMSKEDYSDFLIKAHEKGLISEKNMEIVDPNHTEKTAWDLYNQLTYHVEHSDLVEHSKVSRLSRSATWINNMFIDRTAA